MQFLNYGSVAYLGFSLSRKFIYNQNMLTSSRTHTMQDIEKTRNETASSAFTVLKSEMTEIWTAILNIHNKYNEFREKLSSIELDAEVRKQEISQVEHLYEEVSKLKSTCESFSEAVNSLNRKMSMKLQQDSNHEKSIEKLTQNIANVNGNLDAMAKRIKDIENRLKVLENTLLTGMKQFFQLCKGLILHSIGSYGDEMDDSNLHTE